MNNIKLISVDLDGTLFSSSGKVEPDTLAALAECRKAGIRIIFNTARPLKMIPRELYRQCMDDYWIFSNGTTCMRQNRTVFHITISNPSACRLMQTIHYSYAAFFFSIESYGQIYTSSLSRTMSQRYFAETISLNELIAKPVNKILVIAEDRNFPVDSISRSVTTDVRMLITEKGKYVQFMPRGISKLSAVQQVLKENNIKLENVLSFGDDLNDLELIKASGIGVAMGNADPLLKQHADYVTTSNDRQGVAFFLRAFL